MPATNKQFAISAGAGSQKRLFKFESESPVQTAVSRHLRQAAKRYGAFPTSGTSKIDERKISISTEPINFYC